MARKKRFFKPKATGSTKYDVVDVYRQAFSRQELLDIRRQYSKRANQRILRLERAGAGIGSEPVFTYLRQIGRRRFSEGKGFKGTTWQLKREISALAGFLGAERSTVAGRQAIAKRTISTMAQRYGLNLDSDEAVYLLEHFDEFKSQVQMNSDALLQAIGSVSGDVTKPEQIDKIINELRNKRTVKSQSEAVYRAMYGRRRKGRPGMVGEIAKAIIK